MHRPPLPLLLRLLRLLLALLLLSSCDEDIPAVPERVEFSASPKRTADCEAGDPTRERYGTDCACCHGTQFAASGSIAAEALSAIRHVEVVDRVGQVFFLPPNAYGNFFRHQPTPELPLRGRVVYRDGRESVMRDEIHDASCNHCHNQGTVPMIGASN